jgi:hypothetical protein
MPSDISVGIAAGDANGPLGVVVIERAREGHDADASAHASASTVSE